MGRGLKSFISNVSSPVVGLGKIIKPSSAIVCSSMPTVYGNSKLPIRGLELRKPPGRAGGERALRRDRKSVV